MFTTIDKAWTAFLAPVLVSVAQAVMGDGVSPVDVVTDVNTWVLAVAAGVMVWAIPNKDA